MELRQDDLTGDFVCYSELRDKWPMAFGDSFEAVDHKKNCPFCMENISIAGELVLASGGGNVRVLKNIYPAVSPESGIRGFHEVVVDTPSHEKRLHEFTEDELAVVIGVLARRAAAFAADKSLKYVQILKNQGVNAGASQVHSHWQIIALGTVPPRQARIHAALKEFREKNGRCLVCGLYENKALVIHENGDWYSAAPYAARFGYETVIIPKAHAPRLDGLSAAQTAALAEILLDALRRLNALMPGLDYNICAESGIMNDSSYDESLGHLRISLIPRFGRLGGFELASGGYINSVLPEKAAADMRQVW